MTYLLMIRGENQGEAFGWDAPGRIVEGHAYLDRTEKPLCGPSAEGDRWTLDHWTTVFLLPDTDPCSECIGIAGGWPEEPAVVDCGEEPAS